MREILNEYVRGPNGEPGTDLLVRILHAIRSHLGMDVAFVSEFEGGRRVFRHVDSAGPESPVVVGGSDPLEESYCGGIAAGTIPELIVDAAREPTVAGFAVTRSLPVGSHVSVPLRMSDGRVYGTFCCFSHQPIPSLNARDLSMVRALADLAATQIEGGLTLALTRDEKRARVRGAIDRNEVSSVHQPIYALRDNRLAGLECLARFSAAPHRTPDVWFAEAADVGLGVELELVALEAGLAAFDLVPRCAYLSVNVSPATVVSGELAARLDGFPLDRIVLEITEHAAVRSYEALVAALRPLRCSGLRIAIDDAGAGYANMRHVLNIAPDIVKLDVDLIRNINLDPARRALALAFVAFGREIECDIVAEGVETEAELATLRGLGVMKAQGFLLGRPRPLCATSDVPRLELAGASAASGTR